MLKESEYSKLETKNMIELLNYDVADVSNILKTLSPNKPSVLTYALCINILKRRKNERIPE